MVGKQLKPRNKPISLGYPQLPFTFLRACPTLAENQSMSIPTQTKDAYKPSEVAERLSISRAQVYRLLDRGELKSIKIGRSRRVTLQQLRTFLSFKEREF